MVFYHFRLTKLFLQHLMCCYPILQTFLVISSKDNMHKLHTFALKLDAILIIIVSAVATALVGGIIPKGNVTIGIIVFGVGMMLFTMIMGNAFAAITVMTVGIGAPFVLAYGADPAAIGILALTCGYCGTLCTPMAANFNIVPVAMLDMKDRMGVIKKQVLPAMVMIVVQIVYMLIAQ